MRSRTIAAGLLVATVVGMVGGEVISDRISYKQQTEIQQMREINLLLKNSFKLISCNIEEIIKLNTLRNGIVSQSSKR